MLSSVRGIAKTEKYKRGITVERRGCRFSEKRSEKNFADVSKNQHNTKSCNSQLQFSTSVELESQNVCMSVCMYVRELWGSV